MTYDDIVIGAGASGLSAAILLAQHGRKVAVVEKSPVIAPAIRGFVRKGVYFDTGFHYAAMLEKGKPLARLFERLGIGPHLRVKPNEQKARDIFCHTPSGFTFQYGTTLQDLTAQLTSLFPEETTAIQTYLASVGQFLWRIENGMFALVMDPAKVFEDAELSLGGYLEEKFKSPILKTILSIHSVLYGSWPHETPLNYHIIIAGGYYNQAQQIYNGGHAIALAFEKELKKHNIPVLTNKTVRQIHLHDDNAVKSVALQDGQTLDCVNCIYTGHPGLLAALIPEGAFRPIYRTRLTSLEDTSSAVVVYCRSRNQGNSIPGNIILAHELFPEIYASQAQPGKIAFFISRSISDNYEEGVSIICPMAYDVVKAWEQFGSGDRHPAYYEWKQRITEIIMTQIRKSCPEMLGDLDVIDTATPLTFRDYLNTPRGSLYGTKHRISDMPLTPRTRIRGLYLSGQSIFATGVMGAALSGFISAAYITGEDYRKTMDS